MIPTSTKQSKPKLCRALRALANDNYKNIRNGTDNPVPVSQATGRTKRKRRGASSQPGDETVIRILGSDSNTAKISTDTPEKVKVVVETVEDKEIDIPILKKDKTNVILPWGDLVDFQTETLLSCLSRATDYFWF
jgi:sRNA-binding carbon storage regulator CsrA